MHRLPRFAVVATHNRLADVVALATALNDQCDHLIVIENASCDAQIVTSIDLRAAAPNVDHIVIRDEEQPPNLSRLWNVGIETAATIASLRDYDEWDLAIFNDDTILPSGWFDHVAHEMRFCDVAAACGAPLVGVLKYPVLKTQPDNDPMLRMCPWAFVMRGELNERFDEKMRWWWSDTDMDWRLRQRGGVLILPDHVAINSKANESTIGELAVQAGLDRINFAHKWGYNPW